MIERMMNPAREHTGVLLVVGSNPPTTSGDRTIARVEKVRAFLGFKQAKLVNLFSMPTYRTGGIAQVGGHSGGWEIARVEMMDGLEEAGGVLLADGLTRPSGQAAAHHRDQTEWLDREIANRALACWWVGGAPRHPSRWQRYTYRAYPGLDFEVALQSALVVR